MKKLPKFDTNEIEPILNSVLARQVDGIIWAVPEIGQNHDWLLGRLPDLPIPIIFLTMHQQANLSVVTVDNYLGGRLATEHLLEQGFRNIGHLAGPLAWWEARQRKAGWQDALIDAGLSVDDSHWAEGNWSSESGEALSGRSAAKTASTVASPQPRRLACSSRSGIKLTTMETPLRRSS